MSDRNFSGWVPNRPDHRDLFVPILDNNAQHSLPVQYDIWENSERIPTWDQGQGPACTGFGGSRAAQKTAMEDGQVFGDDRVSPAFLWYNTRELEGTQDQNTGASIRDIFRALLKFGYARESDCPYVVGDGSYAHKPEDKAYSDAMKHEGLVYRRVLPGNGMLRHQIVQGHLIVVGFSVPSYFEDESRWVPGEQALPYPGPMDGFIGGHCVALTGYDYSCTRFKVPVFIADNSWGPEWGFDSGRFAFDIRWFSGTSLTGGLASDLTVITKEN